MLSSHSLHKSSHSHRSRRCQTGFLVSALAHQTLLAECRRCQEKAATSADAPKLFRHARSVPHPGRIVSSSTPLPRWSSFTRGTSLRARAPFACGRVQNGKPSWFSPTAGARAKERSASSATQHLSFTAKNQCVFATVEPIWCTISRIWQINFKQTLENSFQNKGIVLILMKGFDTTDYSVLRYVALCCIRSYCCAAIGTKPSVQWSISREYCQIPKRELLLQASWQWP